MRVSIPDPASIETPAAGVGVVALPYDRDSVLASLEARAVHPAPDTATLDSLFARFRGPFTAYTAVSYAEGALRDSLARCFAAGSTRSHPVLRSTPRCPPGYDRLSDSLRRIEPPGPAGPRGTGPGPGSISSARSESLRGRRSAVGR